MLSIDEINDLLNIQQQEIQSLQEHYHDLQNIESQFQEHVSQWLLKNKFTSHGLEVLFHHEFFNSLISSNFDQMFYHHQYLQILRWKRLGLSQSEVTLMINECRNAFIECLNLQNNLKLFKVLNKALDVSSLLSIQVFSIADLMEKMQQKFKMDVNHIERSYDLVDAPYPAELMRVYEDHVNWKLVAFSLALGEDGTGHLPASTDDCRLGKWLNRGGWKLIPEERHEEFKLAHEQVHELAFKAVRCGNMNQPDKITHFLNGMETASDTVTQNLMQVMERELIHYCTQDSLTNLPNRRMFHESLDKVLAYARRHKLHVGMILLDIDYFKQVNDNYGHLVGDMVLKTLAEVLLDCIRKEERVFRWGGEEFVVITIGDNVDDSKVLAERIRRAIESTLFCKDTEHELHITASCGSVDFTVTENFNFDDTFSVLDKSLYLAKKSGRNRVEHVTLEAEQVFKSHDPI